MDLRHALVAIALIAASSMACKGEARAQAAAPGAPATADKQAALMRADSLVYDPQTDIVSAHGNVEVDYRDEYLRADRLTYNQRTDTIDADGHVTLIDKSGNVLFADHVELRDALKDGVIQRIGMLLYDDSRMAANSAIRLKDNTTVLNKVVFSPCDLCEKDKTRAPLWQIKARRAMHDKAKKEVTYHDATFEIFGLPVAYFPYFSHPDPSVKRKTGFLTPVMGNSTELGTFFTVPYYIALADSYDATITPTYTTGEGPLLRGEFRQILHKGAYYIDGSITHPDERDENNIRTGNKDWRGHFFANGAYDFNSIWEVGGNIQRVSDDTYLRRYRIADYDRLENHVYGQGIQGRNYVDVSAYTFQDLRANDVPGTTPVVAPLIDAAYTLDMPYVGGRTTFRGNALSLTRSSGLDVRRFSGTVDWQRAFIAPLGQVVTGFSSVRTDLYVTNDANMAGIVGGPDNSTTSSRILPEIGVDWRWPFARQGRHAMQVIEPIVQFIYAPQGGNRLNIPNEDSISFEFDDTNLFSDQRFPGFDRWEDGSRFNYGARFAQYWPSGAYIEALGGQSYRLLDESPFAPGSGLDDQASDLVARVTVGFSNVLQFSERLRLDKDSLDVERSETSAYINYWRLTADLTYTLISDAEAAASTTALEGLRTQAAFKLTENWSLLGATQQDFSNKTAVFRELGVGYVNSCVDLGVVYRRDYTRDRDIQPSDSIVLRLRMNNLGG